MDKTDSLIFATFAFTSVLNICFDPNKKLRHPDFQCSIIAFCRGMTIIALSYYHEHKKINTGLYSHIKLCMANFAHKKNTNPCKVHISF